MIRRAPLIALVLFFLSPPGIFAQSDTASVSGRITDQSGGAVVGAQVQAVNLATDIKETHLSNNSGLYVLTGLPPGQYRVIIDKAGFRQIVLSGLILSVQDAISRNFTMEIGSIVQSVTLVAGNEETDISPAVSTVVNSEFVQNMPLNGRSFQSLILLTPGVVPVIDPALGQFSVNGQRADANYLMVDGVSANFGVESFAGLDQTAGGTIPGFTVQGGTNSLVSVDAMQEFRVQTSSFSPEYGRLPGSQISVVTRSGQNDFHGNVFDYLRNDAFDARNYFDNAPLPKPALRQNDFGGTVGGPLLKDRAFFFFSYEGLRLRLPQTDTGEFYTLAARENVAPVYQALLAAAPIPTGPVNADGLTAPLTVAYSDPASFDAYSLRIDYKLTPGMSLFGRYNHAPSTSSDRVWAEVASETVDVDTATFGLTNTFQSNKVNEFRANWSRSTGGISTTMDNFFGAVPPPASALFPPGFSPSKDRVLFFSPGDQDLQIESGRISANIQRQLEFVDTFSISAGTHQFKFGADFRQLTPTSGPTRYRVNVGANSYSELQNGLASFALVEGGFAITSRMYNYSLFAQDVWAASPRLVITYGLRWEINTPLASITPGRPLYTVTGIFDSKPLGLAPAGTPLWHTHFANFAPRLGASYRLNSQTVLRGGGGIFYDLGFGGGVSGTMIDFPYVTSNAGGTEFPFNFNNPAFTPPPLFPQSLDLSTAGFAAAVDPNLRLPRIFEWNGAFERALGPNQSVSLTYVGSYGQDLLRQDVLQIGPTAIPIINVTRNADWSHYNALQVQFQRRMSRGLQALASYTLAKSTDTNSTDLCNCATSDSLRDINVGTDLGASNFDIRNSFSGAVSYELPSPESGRVVHALLKNWAVYGIVRISSAPPLNVLIGANSPDFGLFRTRPDIVPGIPFYVSDPTQPDGRRLNSAAFSAPRNSLPGNLPRNFFRAFPIDQTDIAVSRQVNLSERLALFFRVEYFNLFNHPMFAPPGPIVGRGDFGMATDTLNDVLTGLSPLYQVGGPRSGQFSVKLQF